MNTIDGIIEDLELEDSCVGGCTTKGEIIECLENLKILRKEKETVLKALEDVKAEIEDYNVLRNFVGTSEAFKLGVTKGLDLSAEIINRKIKEIKDES